MPNIETDEQQRVHDILMSVWNREMSADDAFEDLDPGVSSNVEAGTESEPVKANVSVMGQVDVKEPDETTMSVPLGLLLRFDRAEDLRQAIQDGCVEFAL